MNHLSRVFLVLVVAANLLTTLRETSCSAAPYLLVNGQNSQNVVRFDLTGGAATLFATYNTGADPRNLALDSSGNLYSSVQGGNRNVVKLVPQPGTSVLTTVDFTSSIGGDGPGQIQFSNGNLYVAADFSRTIFRYNGTTGLLNGALSATTSYNIRAMAINGDTLYYEEAFQNRVRETNLTQTPYVWNTLIEDPTNLAKAINMTIGPLGTLVFANANSTLVQQYASDGTFLGTLADVKMFDSTLTGAWGVLYSAALHEYFVSAGSEVFELDVHGTLLHTYSSGLLQVATGMVVVPEPGAWITAALAFLGFIGVLWRGRGRITSP